MKKRFYVIGLIGIAFIALLILVFTSEGEKINASQELKLEKDVQQNVSKLDEDDQQNAQPSLSDEKNGNLTSLTDSLFHKKLENDIKGRDLSNAIQYIRTTITGAYMISNTGKMGTTLDSAVFVLKNNARPVFFSDGRGQVGKIVLRADRRDVRRTILTCYKK